MQTPTFTCATCDAPVTTGAVFHLGLAFCCAGCAADGPCMCSYDTFEAAQDAPGAAAVAPAVAAVAPAAGVPAPRDRVRPTPDLAATLDAIEERTLVTADA